MRRSNVHATEGKIQNKHFLKKGENGCVHENINKYFGKWFVADMT